MKKLIVLFIIPMIMIQTAFAEDVFMATSEDLKEFDRILSKENKNVPPPPQNPRDRFLNKKDEPRNDKNPNDKNGRPPRQNSFDQRPPPGSGAPGGQMPPPPPQGGSNPQPPPP
jgi:hypothetical protein